MSQKKLALWLRAVITGCGLCGLCIYLVVLPLAGREMTADYPEYAGAYLPWLIFLWLTAVPCYLVLVCGWQIAIEIGQDNSFSYRNAKLLSWVSWLALIDSGLFFAGNLILLAFQLSHPVVVVASMFVVFAGAAIAAAAAILSHLVRKAASLQEDSNLTI